MGHIEAEVRAFAAEFAHLANVRRMVWLCESGRISWAQAQEIARDALATGLAEVAK